MIKELRVKINVDDTDLLDLYDVISYFGLKKGLKLYIKYIKYNSTGDDITDKVLKQLINK